MSWSKKILAYLLVFAMTLSLVPVTAQAEEAEEPVESQEYELIGILGDTVNETVPVGTSVTLRVDGEMSDGYTYEWRKKDVEASRYDAIEGATGMEYVTEALNTQADYVFYVFDNERGELVEEYYFIINIKSGFEAYVAGTSDCSTELFADEEGSVTLQVDARVDVGDISYTWYRNDSENDAEDTLLASTPEATEECTVNGIEEYTEFYCIVKDDYGNFEQIMFCVYVDSGLYAYADKEAQMTWADVKVDYGDATTMTVYAGANKGEVSCQWYKDDVPLEADIEESVTDKGVYVFTCPTDAVTTKATYRCEVSDEYGGSQSVDFYVCVDSGLTATVANSKDTEASVYVPAGGITTLEVATNISEGVENKNITCEWYDTNPDGYEEDAEDYPELLGTGSSFETPEINTMTYYFCQVSDAYGNEIIISFSVYVKSGLVAYVKDSPDQDTQKDIEVSLGDSAQLDVYSEVADGENIYYKWYLSTDTEDILLEEDGENYTVNDGSCTVSDISERCTYYCEVSDDYGQTITVYFYLSVDTQLTISAVGEEEVYVPLNGTTVLEVEASAAEGVNLNYQWSRYNPDTQEYDDIEGATRTSLITDAITRNEEYRCEVNDSCGSATAVCFNVYVATEFAAEPVGEEIVYVSAGQSVDLEVVATSDTPVTYAWHQKGEDGWYAIEGATDKTYTTGPITLSTGYICEVTDSYGNSIPVSFSVRIDNGFSVVAVGETDLTVSKNDTVTLQVEASANSGEFTYQWLQNESWLEDATAASYTAENVTEYAHYTCMVTDAYNNMKYVDFYIRVNEDTGLTVVADGDTTVEVKSGTRATLKVIANTTAETELTYLWHQYDSEEQEWIIYDEGRNSSKTPVIKADSQFKCVVRDQYGNEKEVLFTVKPATSQGSGDSPEGGNGSSSEGGTGGSTSEGGNSGNVSGGTEGGSDGTTGGTDGSTSGDGSNKNDQTSTGDDTQKEENKLVTKIKVTGVSKKIAAGKKLTLKAEVTPADATNKNVVWSSSNKKYATVNAKGVVTTKKAGAGKTVTITAEAQDGSGIKATYKITIMKHTVKSVKISAKTKQVKAGRKLTLKAVVKTTGKKVNKTLKWSSSNTKYATVNAKGVVTAKKAGKGKTVKITAMATDGSGKKATITIKIK